MAIEIFATDGTDEGRLLVARLLRTGGGRGGRPVSWLVYWGLKFSDQPARRFARRHEAVAWVRSVLRELQAAPAARAGG
jgi:hypothetical protein